MQALILAGGLGTRLQSIVNDRPKPMASIGDKPFLEHQLAFLKSYQIDELIFCVGYLHQQIQAYFGDGARWGVKITYSVEKTPLGTGGAIKLAEKYVQGPFLTLNGDSFFDIDLDQLRQFHREKERESRRELSRGAGEGGGRGEIIHSPLPPCPPAPRPRTPAPPLPRSPAYLGTIALTRVQDGRSYGSVSLDPEGKIINFAEKSAVAPSLPSQEGAEGSQINAGVYLLEPEIFQFIPAARKVSIERETFPAILRSGHHLGGYPAPGFFVDIGTPAGYYQFKHYLKEKLYDHQK